MGTGQRTRRGIALLTACAAFAACADLGGLSGSGDTPPIAADGAAGDGAAPPSDGEALDAKGDVDPGKAPADCPMHLDASADGAPNVTLLAVAENAPVRIATDDATVFWIAQNGASTTIRACTAAGCNGAPTTVTTFNRAYGYLATDALNVYYADGYTPGTVRKCPHTGCPDGSVISTNLYAPNGIVTDGADVYWTVTGSGIIGTCKAPDCTSASDLLTGEQGARRIALDALTVYWMTDSGNVRACTRTDCVGSVRSLAGGQAVPGEGALAVSSTTVVWANGKNNGTATIASCSVNGCNLQPSLVVGNLPSPPKDIVTDGVSVYWIDASSLKTCPLTGCASPTTLLASLANPQGLAIDARQGCATALYVAVADGTVRKLVL